MSRESKKKNRGGGTAQIRQIPSFHSTVRTFCASYEISNIVFPRFRLMPSSPSFQKANYKWKRLLESKRKRKTCTPTEILSSTQIIGKLSVEFWRIIDKSPKLLTIFVISKKFRDALRATEGGGLANRGTRFGWLTYLRSADLAIVGFP